jgi:hypothetical protein
MQTVAGTAPSTANASAPTAATPLLSSPVLSGSDAYYGSLSGAAVARGPDNNATYVQPSGGAGLLGRGFLM